MKSTGSKTAQIKSGQIPLTHDPLVIDEAADYVLWLEEQLELLESRFAGYKTRNSTFVNTTKNRSI
jgi:hypothetical protein